MGNRANFVVVENRDWQLYYSHWAGCRMLDALIGGPTLAVRYVRALRPCAKNDWVCPLWADGGAVVDLDCCRLLFYGDELMLGMAERRAALSVLGAVWPDYAIRWAYDGTAELAEYLGVQLPLQTPDEQSPLELAANPHALGELVSVADSDGRLLLWPLRHVGQGWHGPAVLDTLPGRGVAQLTLNAIPESGVHVDVRQKTVATWQTADTGIFRALPGLWRGWRTQCWGDRFEEHVRRCNGALRLPELDLAAGVAAVQARIHHRVFQSAEDGPAARLLQLAKLLVPAALGLVIGNDAVADGAIRPTDDEWVRFADACDGLRADPAISA